MKRLFSSIALSGCLWGVAELSFLPLWNLSANVQAQTFGNLHYNFYGQQIPLNLRQDTIAVEFKTGSGKTRGSSLSNASQLQRELQRGSGDTRGGGEPIKFNVEVNALGDRYALVSIPKGSTRGNPEGLKQVLEQKSYIQGTLPVLSRTDRDEKIVLPNEIIISFQPGTSEAQKQLILLNNNLEVIRSLRFTKDKYVVRSRSGGGINILNTANTLNNAEGVKYSTPNFLQSVSYGLKEQGLQNAAVAGVPQNQAQLKKLLTELAARDNNSDSPYQSDLLPLQWHLDSTPQRGKYLPRTDVHAIDAWKNSNAGSGVIVAVIDSLIEWDHPDLINNVYTVPEDTEDKLPDEVHGWDFAQDDADTRISEEELEQAAPIFKEMFTLSNDELLEKYPDLAAGVASYFPDFSKGQVATFIRNYIRNTIAAEFHGTWSSGVIAAHAADGKGVMGVAPNAQILPVRVFGLGGSITPAALADAIRYAAARGANVINMSLGGFMPGQEEVEAIFEVLDAHPNLVIIASAGNESLDGVAFPSAVPGVLSVGATNLAGKRTVYSNYGGQLAVVAPGGDTSEVNKGGILTTGGTWVDGFWQGVTEGTEGWGVALDNKGKYVQVQGTSFSAPTVSGVMALMIGEDPKRSLGRDRLVNILKQTSTYEPLNISTADNYKYRLQKEVGFGTALNFQVLRPSGIFPLPQPVTIEQYYFGSGLVNSAAAVEQVKRERF